MESRLRGIGLAYVGARRDGDDVVGREGEEEGRETTEAG